MFTLFAPRKLQNAAAALVTTIVVLGAAVSPFASTAAQAVPTVASTR